MGIEIERRFIVNNRDWETLSNKGNKINQGYINENSEGLTTRVRIINESKSYLTLKSYAGGFTNHEFEYEIPIEDGKSLMLLCKNKISKTRYILNIENHQWVVDCFHEKNSPLILAEIELDSQSQKFNIPPWCKNEISGKSIWSNASLAKNPITTWSMKKRQEEGLT